MWCEVVCFFMKFFYSTPLQTRKNASFDLTSNYFQPNFCICFIRLQFYLNFLIASFVFPSRPITEETRLDVMTGSPAGSCVRTRLGTLELIFALRPTSAATQSFKNHPIQAGSVLWTSMTATDYWMLLIKVFGRATCVLLELILVAEYSSVHSWLQPGIQSQPSSLILLLNVSFVFWCNRSAE